MTYQRVIAIGNLGKDPATRYTQSGSAVTSFSVACSEKWKDKQSNEWKEKTEWINCVAFGRLAEVCGEYLKKGSKVMVEGKLSTSSWEKDGQKQYKTEVNISEMKMLGSKEERSTAPPRQQDQAAPPPIDDDFDDDIPF